MLLARGNNVPAILYVCGCYFFSPMAFLCQSFYFRNILALRVLVHVVSIFKVINFPTSKSFGRFSYHSFVYS